MNNLNIGYNNLTSETPSSLGELQFVFIMILEANALTGEIPQSFVGLNAVRIGLSFNNLSGAIPMPLGNPELTRTISASHNNLSGSLDDMFEDYEQLAFVSLSDNNLTGEIPPSLLNNEAIESLYLNDNNFSSCYPADMLPEICSLEFSDKDTIVEVGGEMVSIFVEEGYNFTNNPLLPWEGDFERFCNGEDQIGAPCNDGNSMTDNDVIMSDCSCQGEIVSAVRDLEGIELNIYPNPIQSELFVEADKTQNLKARLLNLVGQTVMSIEFNVANDIHNLESGIHLLSIQNESGVQVVERLIKP